jgi:hypothetical protein
MILAWWAAASAPAPASSPAPAPAPARPGVRYAVVDGGIRRLVTEREYRTTVTNCSKIEVIRYPGETVVTNVCYR